MIMSTRKGFTLVELLIVITIIAVLVTILAPAMNAIVAKAKRAVCATRLEAIGKGALSYAADNDQSLPYRADGSEVLTNIGFKYANALDGTSDRCESNTRPWYQLVRGGYVPLTSFVCPGDDDAKPVHGGQDYYDFPTTSSEARPLSYSLQAVLSGQTKQSGYDPQNSQHGKPVTLMNDSSLVIAADRGRVASLSYDSREGGYCTSRGYNYGSKYPETTNSENHGGKGQNILLLTGTVKYEETPLCGVDGDNIWTRRDTIGSKYAYTTDRPADAKDSRLVP